ncbi:MAG: peptidoglycan DD-metalloendopeptidase family protein [Sphaerospermopsis sp. SIO1G2]|nr:peptidoglycan DD-metalloendopeptidase family protein [Sphaerospermopsis sp. SIO1G2]
MKTLIKTKLKLWFLLPFLSLLILWLNLFALSVYATSSPQINQLKQQQQEIQKKRQNVIEQNQNLTNLQNQAQQHLEGIEENLQSTNDQIKISKNRLNQATKTLEKLLDSLVITERNYEERRLATIARLRFLQRSHSSQGLAVLLQSANLTDFINRRQRLKLVYQADQKILAKLIADANLLIQQRTEVERQKNQIAIIREQLLVQQAGYQAQADLQTNLINRLNSDRLALMTAQEQLEQDSQNLTILIQQKIAEQKAKEKREAQAKANSKIWIRGTGIFAFPSNAPTSSPFGWRTHPILGYRRFHAGLDFAASYGSTIRAADSGKVIFAGWYGGYGRSLIIDHSRGITTLYAHCSQLYVSNGQRVQKGQAIAAVGSTGLSTGPHLHFEVRRNGSPVNPAKYL